jgi:NADPH-dependent glutamate synthase beta subunit-like oxidoreductase
MVSAVSFSPTESVRNGGMAGRATQLTVPVAVVGGGPAGLTAAIALAAAGAAVRPASRSR